MVRPFVCTSCGAGKYLSGLGMAEEVCTLCEAGKYQGNDTIGADSCTQCEKGKFQSQPGQTNCSVCGPGTYQPFTGVVFEWWCGGCPAGTFSTAIGAVSAATCQPCSAGRYTDVDGNTSCSLCPIGKYAPVAGANQCYSCMSGTYSNSTGSSECTPCAVGQSLAAVGGASCNSCGPGEFQFREGAAACIPCSPGLYQTGEAATSCTPCQPGSAQPGLNQSECLLCAPGTFTSLTGQTICSQCAPGHYQTSNQSTSCVKCTAGTFATGTGLVLQSECTNCSAGWYNDNQGMTFCMFCGVGSFGPIAGSTVCTLCTPGSFQLDTGTTLCRSCLAGSFSTASGAGSKTDCGLCTAGSFASEVGQTSCQECREGTFADANGTLECSLCPEGTYMMEKGGRGEGQCTKCPSGTFSSGQGMTSNGTCVMCGDGLFSPGVGQTSESVCETCPAGTVSVDNKTFCRVCVSGELCPAGYHAPIVCVAGLHCNGTHMEAGLGALAILEGNCTGVIWCPAGTQCALRNQTLGKGIMDDALHTASNRTYFIVFENGSSSTPLSCQDEVVTYGYARVNAPSDFFGVDGRVLYRLLPQVCSAGHYLLGDTCTPCPQGTFMVEDGALSVDTCQPCPIGTYSWRTGVTSCVPCPAGGFSKVLGAIACSVCRAGTFQSTTGGTSCSPCAAGSFASNARSTLCVLCAAGSYQSVTAATGCLACETGQYSSPGDNRCSQCGVDQTSLDPGFSCPLPSLPAVTDAATWLSVKGQSSDDCVSLGKKNGTTGNSLEVVFFAVSGRKPAVCVTTLIIANRPELKRSWMNRFGALQPPKTLQVVPFNETFYPALCSNQGFGVLFTLADADGEMLTYITGGKAVMSLLDPSGENVLFSVGCSRLPVDSNSNVPLGMCRTTFCPTMTVLVRVTLVRPAPAPPVIGETLLSPGPVAACPPTTSWMAAVQLDDHSVPHMAGDTIRIQVVTLNQPANEALVVFRFALRILGGVTFMSFHSTYSVVVDFVEQGSVLTVVGDSSLGGGAVLGVLSLRLDAAVSGVVLVAQIIPSSFQFTLSNAVPYTMLVRTLGFSCRSDSYVDVLMDVVRTTSLITNVKRRDVVNWRKIQASASDFPTAIFTVAVGNVMHSYGAVTALCRSMVDNQYSLVVKSCGSISGGSVGSPAAIVRVMYQTAYTDVSLSVWVPVSFTARVFTSPGGMHGRYSITAALSNGVHTLSGVDATPYIPNILGLGASISNEQWFCLKSGLGFTVGVPILFSGMCGVSSGTQQTPSSYFLFAGGLSGVTGLGTYVFPPALISGASPAGSVLLFSEAGDSLSIAGLTNLSPLNQLTTITTTSGSAEILLKNTGTSARCVPVLVEPLLGRLWSPFTAYVQVFPGGPVSLQIILSTYIVVSPTDTSLFIPSSTFVVQAIMVFSDGGRFMVQADARLRATSDDMQISGIAATATNFFTGSATLVFGFEGISCLSTVVNVQVLQTAVRDASLVCLGCPAVIALDSDPLSQQHPGLYPSFLLADTVVVRRLLWDGRSVDRAEALSVTGNAVSLENGQIIGRNPGISTLSTAFTPGLTIQVMVIKRWVVSVAPVCNGDDCSSLLKLAPLGNGASMQPFSYATSLRLSLAVGLYNGSSRLFPWLQGVTALVNQTAVTSPLITPLVFGEILVQIRLAQAWEISTSVGFDAGVRLSVQQLSFITLVGPLLLRQMHCSGVWEEGRYTTTATLTDLTSKEISPVFTSSPLLVKHHHSDGLFHADGVGSGLIHARFGEHETSLSVTATVSSRYFTAVSLAFLPSTWNASVGQQIEMAAVLSPWPVTAPWFSQAFLSSKVVEWTSSDPSAIQLSLDRQTITLLADCYKDVVISAVLAQCDPAVLPASRQVVTRAVTVNVIPAHLGDFDFGGENGAPLGLVQIGQIMQIPVYLFVGSDALKAYMVDIELPGLGVEPVDCSPGVIANSQCAVLMTGTVPSVFRAVGAFSQSQLTGRILVATIQCRVLLNALTVLQIRLLQGLAAGAGVMQPHASSYLVRLGVGSLGASSVTPLGLLLPSSPGVTAGSQQAAGVFGDTDGDGTFSTMDVLFMESYMAVSVSRGEQSVCVERLNCQSTSRLSVWQLLQLKPVRNPGMPASRPDGSDVIFLLRALVGKAFFLAALDIKARGGTLSFALSLRDYQQRLNPPNAVVHLEITTVGNRNLVFDTPFKFTLSTSTLSVVCRRDDEGFSASSLPSTLTTEEQTVGLKVRVQSLNVMMMLGSNQSAALALDRTFLFNPTGPVASFPITGTGPALLLPDPVVLDYLPTLNCEHLCDDASLFLDDTEGVPAWINDTAFSVRTFQGVMPVFWGEWPGYYRQTPDVGASYQPPSENSYITPYNVDVGVSVGSLFNVSFQPDDAVAMGLYRVECAPPLRMRAVYGTNLPVDSVFIVNPLVSKAVQLEFWMGEEDLYVITVTQVQVAVGSGMSAPHVQRWRGVSVPFVRLVVTPLCTQGVILWSKLVATAEDELCEIEVTGLLSLGASSVMTFTCKIYPCVFQGFGQIIRPVIKTYIPSSPRLMVQQPILSVGQWTQWRAQCVLTGSDGGTPRTISVNNRALKAGLIRGMPLHALEISRDSVRGVKQAWAAVNFAGVVKAGLNITESVNPPRALRAWLFQSIGFSLNGDVLTTVFKTGSLQAGGRSFLLLKADYRGGYTMLLDPGSVDGLSVKGASSQIAVSQVDGGVYVSARAPAAATAIPVLFIEYQGVTLTVSAEIISLTPARMVLCCAPVLASASSVLSGLSDFPSGFVLEDPWIHFVNDAGAPLQLKLVDSSLQITHDPAVLQYVASTGGWALTPGAASYGTTEISVRYTHPGSLVSVEASLVVTMVTAYQLDLSSSSSQSDPVTLKRIHCSPTAFERVDVRGVLQLRPSGVRGPYDITSGMMALSSSAPSVAAVSSSSSSSQGCWVEGRGVGSASVVGSFKGLTGSLAVTVVGDSVVIQTASIPAVQEISGVKDVTVIPVLMNWTLSSGKEVVQEDISALASLWLQPTQYMTMQSASSSLVVHGNTVGSQSTLRVTIPICLPLAPTALVVESLLTARLVAPVHENTADVQIRLEEGGLRMVVTLVAAPPVLAVYIQLQTNAPVLGECIPSVGSRFLGPFFDCNPNYPGPGSVVLAGSGLTPLRQSHTEIAVVRATPGMPLITTVWGMVEVYNGISAVRYSVQAGVFGLQIALESNHSVDRLMPTLPIVDTSIIYRHLVVLFHPVTRQPSGLRDALFMLLLLVGRQRNVETRLYSTDFEFSAMFFVTDRFFRPDTNETGISVLLHTDQFPQTLDGTVMDPAAGGMRVPATHVMDGWYVAEFRQKIPRLTLAVSFDVVTKSSRFPWTWQVAQPVETGLPAPACPRLATQTATFLASYQIRVPAGVNISDFPYFIQNLVDKVGCSVQVPSRRVMASFSGQTMTLSIALESLVRVRQANLIIMGGWLADEFAAEMPASQLRTLQEITIERGDLKYINDTGDPPIPCPDGYFFSRNGTYHRLPQHAVAGTDCYDMFCKGGYVLMDDTGHCIPVPATRDIVWICVTVVLTLVMALSALICCVHMALWKTAADIGEVVFDPNTAVDQTQDQPAEAEFSPVFDKESDDIEPFGDTDEHELYFQNIVINTGMDDYSSTMMMDEDGNTGEMTSVYLGSGPHHP